MEVRSDDEFLRRSFPVGSCKRCPTFCVCNTLTKEEKIAEWKEEKMLENFNYLRSRSEYEDIRGENRRIDPKMNSKINMFYSGRPEEAYSYYNAGKKIAKDSEDFIGEGVRTFGKIKLHDQLQTMYGRPAIGQTPQRTPILRRNNPPAPIQNVQIPRRVQPSAQPIRRNPPIIQNSNQVRHLSGVILKRR